MRRLPRYFRVGILSARCPLVVVDGGTVACPVQRLLERFVWCCLVWRDRLRFFACGGSAISATAAYHGYGGAFVRADSWAGRMAVEVANVGGAAYRTSSGRCYGVWVAAVALLRVSRGCLAMVAQFRVAFRWAGSL
ncbi:hypothetical protein KCP71_10490 [Salmonella enterica subsp. enterica]|nr:hypothetical protein KCP71_10490 [Salmonella enterica subsp. enterica]